MLIRFLIMSLISLPTAAAGQWVANVANERVLAESMTGENWFLKGGSFNGDHYSPLSQINEENVGDLSLAWTIDLPIPDGTPTTPIVVNGVIYIGGAYSKVVAIDAVSGEQLWSYAPDLKSAFSANPMNSWISRANRGVAVWNDSVYATTSDCRLISLHAKTGIPQWMKQTCDIAQGYTISDSPYVGGGKIFVGNAGSEREENNRGYISAYDAKSGELVWRFFIVPSHIPEENDTPALKMAAQTWSGNTLKTVGGGGNSWNEMTYDPVSNQLFFGTAGSAIMEYGKRSPDGGDNLFLSSIVAVNADTGEYNWHYQTVDQDSWDYNATMNIILAKLNIDGKQRDAVLTAPKNGFHYALDLHTGELLTAGKYAKVNWATHINIETGRPVYDSEAEFWNIPDGETVLIWPNFWGAHSWNPMAFHPGLGLSYIPVIDVPSKSDNMGDGEELFIVTEIDGEAHAPGKLVAFDPATQNIRWSVEHVLPFNGGVMATGGNLVFQGNAKGEFVAYAADSGDELWSVQTGSAINAAPASYSVNNTQYVLIPIGVAGGLQFLYPKMHAANEANGPVRLMAFSLSGAEKMPSPGSEHRSLPDQPALKASVEEIQTGKALYADACFYCHGADGVARIGGGTVPDLRYANVETHATWHAIVIGGTKAENGMPSVGLNIGQSEAIRKYILSLSEEMRVHQ